MLAIAASGSYLLAGGTLQVGSLVNQGIFTGNGSAATLSDHRKIT
jgi:hypothetical protein